MGYNVLSVVYQQVPKVSLTEGEQPPPNGYPVQLSVNASIGVSEERVAQLRLVLGVVPDAHVQPYNIVVDVVGTFSTRNGTAYQLGEFCRLAAPGILFPYIRELIDRTTTYAPYGAVRLDPMNINQLINQTPWADVPQPVKAPTGVSSTSPARP